jgi:hypothetical protein
MILKEWKDANGNKVSSSSTTNNSPSNSSGSFKKRLNKLIDYADKHKYSKINKVEIKSLDDDAADFIEHYDGGGTIEYVIYVNPVTEDWQLNVYTTDIYYKGKQTAHEASGTGWSVLLKELRYYVMIPTVGTPEYKELLTEWVDANGNKVGTSSTPQPTTSAKPQSQVKRYSKLLKQIDTDGLSTRRINKFNDTTLDITVNTAKRHDLNLRMEYQPVTDDYIFTVDGKTSKGWAWFEDILELLIIGGVIKNTNLCESASFAEDFKLYENLWD